MSVGWSYVIDGVIIGAIVGVVILAAFTNVPIRLLSLTRRIGR